MTDVKLAFISENRVPRPYADLLHGVMEGVYTEDTFQKTAESLAAFYKEQGIEVVSIEPMKVVLRQYLDETPEEKA